MIHTSHAARQIDLYASIWAADPNYGTRQSDVDDTVAHRIVPHMQRVFGEQRQRMIDFGAMRVIDFGAGDGRFLRALHAAGWVSEGRGVDVHLPRDLPDWMSWNLQTLWEPITAISDYAISTDALEHMPPEMVPAVLRNISAAAEHGFLRISTRQDVYGTERGLHLHETVENADWWLRACAVAHITPTSWRVYPGHALEVWW